MPGNKLVYAFENYCKYIMKLNRYDYQKAVYQKKVQLDPNYQPEFKDAVIEFLHFLRKRIFQTKYIVHMSHTLQQDLQNANLPWKAAFDEIKLAFINGEDIFPYLRHDKDWGITDALLQNWDIYHLHLNKKNIQKNNTKQKKVQTSDYILFVRVSGSTAYFICVENHPKGDAWFNKNYLEIINANWPHLLTKLKVPVAINTSSRYNAYAAKVSYKKGLNLIIELDSRETVLPNSMGIVSSGHRLDLIKEIESNYYLAHWLNSNLTKIINYSKGFFPEYLRPFRGNGFILVMTYLYNQSIKSLVLLIHYSHKENICNMLKCDKYFVTTFGLATINGLIRDITKFTALAANQFSYLLLNSNDHKLIRLKSLTHINLP